MIADKQRFENAAQHAAELLEQQLEKMTDRTGQRSAANRDWRRDREAYASMQYFPEIYKYISLLYPERQTLLDYMPSDTLLILDEPTRLIETARQLERDEAEWSLHLLQNGKSLPGLAARATIGRDRSTHRPFPDAVPVACS